MLLGAIIASLLIQLAVTLAGWFFQNTSLSSALQVAGGFTLLLLGFDQMAQIFLLGLCVAGFMLNYMAQGVQQKMN